MMSMLSAQCDELREKAKLLRGHVDGLSAPYVIPSTKELMALTMLDSADRMEQAADTILELRDDLQRANDAVQDAEHDESMAWDRVRKAEAENVKLRYKVHVLENGNKWLQILNSSFKANNSGLRDFAYDIWNDMNVYYTQHESPDSSDMDFYRDRMRELGVEVDG